MVKAIFCLVKSCYCNTGCLKNSIEERIYSKKSKLNLYIYFLIQTPSHDYLRLSGKKLD